MKRALTISIVLLAVLMMTGSCTSRKYNSFWVGHRGRYVVHRHGHFIHFPFGHKRYGRRVKMKVRGRHRLINPNRSY